MFGGIAGVLIFAYLSFFKGSPQQPGLVPTPFNSLILPGSGLGPPGGDSALTAPGAGSSITSEFLSILLNIRNIKLDDSILSDPAFKSLKDSSIVLIQDSEEGRPNPFAPIGTDAREASTQQSTPPPFSPGGQASPGTRR